MSKNKSITPVNPADFTPTLGDYKTLHPFRYWCQKVLPLVYDDSLSYYELLCKVVDYLNKAMEDVEVLHEDVTKLHAAYSELQGYINSYFEKLNVQEEINNKLNEMAENGTLSELIAPYINVPSLKFANSLNEMTDKTANYVLSSTGDLYQWNGNSWVQSGLNYSIPNGTYRVVQTFGNTYTQDVNLNNLTTIGTYLFAGVKGNVINAPSASNFDKKTFELFVLNDTSQGGGYQIIRSLNGNLMFTRAHWGATWYEWKTVYNNTSPVYHFIKTFPNTYTEDVDLNNLKPCFYLYINF